MIHPILPHAADRAPVYGLAGAMHGGGKTLTLMSADGAEELAGRLAGCHDVHLVYFPASLPLLIEKQQGGLQQVINTLAITVLIKAEWDRKKLTLGDRIYT